MFSKLIQDSLYIIKWWKSNGIKWEWHYEKAHQFVILGITLNYITIRIVKYTLIKLQRWHRHNTIIVWLAASVLVLFRSIIYDASVVENNVEWSVHLFILHIYCFIIISVKSVPQRGVLVRNICWNFWFILLGKLILYVCLSWLKSQILYCVKRLQWKDTKIMMKRNTRQRLRELTMLYLIKILASIITNTDQMSIRVDNVIYVLLKFSWYFLYICFVGCFFLSHWPPMWWPVVFYPTLCIGTGHKYQFYSNKFSET